MYAKLVLRESGKKEYLAITEDDRLAYKRAEDSLHALDPPLPHVPIEPGHNTNQVLNYSYKYWDEMFNARQLLSLSILAGSIRQLPVCPERDALMLLFSGTLEFNNMFASYKGEGTGAVRHMFSHHILKPERTPIEANLWGTPKSSGSFSTLFKSRLLRALRYKEQPFEIRVARKGKSAEKVYGLSPSIGSDILDQHPIEGLPKGAVYISCGTSTDVDLPTGSVDLVLTDPPFFDNVHYAELADFFHVWQEIYFDKQMLSNRETTRHPEEVQDTSAEAFALKLTNVFRECHRVLRDEGLLVFSYHHSRKDGWSAVASAVLGSGFSIVQAQPVKSEMSAATPKSQAKSPIDLDVYLVCRKRSNDDRIRTSTSDAFARGFGLTSSRLRRFNSSGRMLSKNDVKVIFLSQILVELSAGRPIDEFLCDFEELVPQVSSSVTMLWTSQGESLEAHRQTQDRQLELFDSIGV